MVTVLEGSINFLSQLTGRGAPFDRRDVKNPLRLEPVGDFLEGIYVEELPWLEL